MIHMPQIIIFEGVLFLRPIIVGTLLLFSFMMYMFSISNYDSRDLVILKMSFNFKLIFWN
jgi:hypothetical protein